MDAANRIMRVAIYVHGENFPEIESAMATVNAQLVYQEVGDNLSPVVVFKNLPQVRADAVIIDMDAFANLDEFMRSLRQYKIQSVARLIIFTEDRRLAAEMFPALLSMEIYDIRLTDGDLQESIARMLVKPNSYNDVAGYENIELEPAKSSRINLDNILSDMLQVIKYLFKSPDKETKTNSNVKNKPAGRDGKKRGGQEPREPVKKPVVKTARKTEKIKYAEDRETGAKIIGTVVIAVCGVTRGIGCTHTSLVLARYLSRHGHNVAINQMNPNGAMDRLAYSHNILRTGNKRRFVYKNVTIHNQARVSTLLSYGYDYLILDVGSLLKDDYRRKALGDSEDELEVIGRDEYVLDEINRADYRILLTGASVWHQVSLADLLNTEEMPEKKWHILFKDVPEKEKRNIDELMDEYNYNFFPVIDIDDDTSDDLLADILRNVLPDGNKRRRVLRLVR